eukprot:gene14136-15613_t
MSEYGSAYRKWPEDTEGSHTKQKYRSLKRKMRCLLYEQECFQEELRRLQRKLLRVNRDKSFLLDRLLQYEPPEFSSSDEEETASSAEESQQYKNYWNSQGATIHPNIGQGRKGASQGHGAGSAPHESKSQQKSKRSTDVERVRCRHVENGKRCPKMVAKRVKTGLCTAHRNLDSKPTKSNKQQAMHNIIQPRPEVTYFNQPNPMISGISSEHTQQSAPTAMPEEMYSMTEMHQDSTTADSPASSDFNSNIYDGDDDLVIDLPE